MEINIELNCILDKIENNRILVLIREVIKVWVKSLRIKEFRAFQNEFELELAKNVTCISGHNAVGKSTILAVLSNCGELKSHEGTHLNGSSFRGEFADIIKGDEEFDSIGEKVTMLFSAIPKSDGKKIYVKELTFRTTRQDGRYRLLPKKIKGIRETEAKLSWPTYYLGLSRLYPVGESKEVKKGTNLDSETDKVIIETHSKILSISYGENSSARHINIRENTKKKIGIRTDSFSETANSAGQDNIAQIITTVLSFERLKEKLKEKYNGGLLLIDELDATLHPAVQKSLYDYLHKKSKELDLQIVFTTHSLTLIEHVYLSYKKSKVEDEVKIAYLRRRSNGVNVLYNPPPAVYERDLNDTYLDFPPATNKIKVITEDDSARWFIKKIIDYRQMNDKFPLLDFLEIDISWAHIIKLIVSDLEVYKNYLAILDPDINKPEHIFKVRELIEGYPLSVNEFTSNIFTIPSPNNRNYNIEKMLWDYVTTISDIHILFDDPSIQEWNWQQHLIKRDGIESDKYANLKENMKYKEWFKNNKYRLAIVVRYWVNDYRTEVDEFLSKLLRSYEKINKDLNLK